MFLKLWAQKGHILGREIVFLPTAFHRCEILPARGSWAMEGRPEKNKHEGINSDKLENTLRYEAKPYYTGRWGR